MKQKIVENGIIISIGEGNIGTPISDAEYNRILSAAKNRPIAPAGYRYDLKDETLEFVLVETPPEPEPELSDSEALEILLGGGDA